LQTKKPIIKTRPSEWVANLCFKAVISNASVRKSAASNFFLHGMTWFRALWADTTMRFYCPKVPQLW
jgi:hypothetical protein